MCKSIQPQVDVDAYFHYTACPYLPPLYKNYDPYKGKFKIKITNPVLVISHKVDSSLQIQFLAS